MKKSIKIVGGMSSPSRIALSSETHIAVARCVDGRVECHVRERTAFSKRVRSLPRFLVPRFVQIGLDILSEMPPKVAVCVAVAIVVSHVMPVPEATLQSDWSWIPLIGTLALIAYTLVKTRGWHAAEHQALAAYEMEGDSVSVNGIRAAERVSGSCGGRLFLPLILTSHGLEVIGIGSALAAIASIEFVMWVDHFRKWSQIPVFKQASTILQRYVTTKPANELEIATAEAALGALIAAGRGE